MIKIILLLAYFFFMIWLFWYASRKNRPEEPEKIDNSMVDVFTLDEIEEKKNKIKLLSDMIADIQSCDPDNLLRTVTVTVNEYQRGYTFIVNGQDNISNELVNLFWMERGKLNTSLREDIRKIQ